MMEDRELCLLYSFFCWLIQGHDRHVVVSSSCLWVKLLHTAQPVSARVSERCAWGVDCAFIGRIKGRGIPLALIQIMSEFYYLQLCGREPQRFSSCGWEAACSFYQANCCSTRYGLLLSNQLFYVLHEGAPPQVGQFSQILRQEGESFLFVLKRNIPTPTTTTTKPTDTKSQNELPLVRKPVNGAKEKVKKKLVLPVCSIKLQRN